jgi:hypothetical protein
MITLLLAASVVLAAREVVIPLAYRPHGGICAEERVAKI